eukprot:3039812-Alexandrium_andersonii.AAC.1
MLETPALILANETFLDKASGNPALTGYTCISRRDRYNDWGGGVAVFAPDAVADLCTFLSVSPTAER